jgi:hypothetical protein
MHYKKGKQAYEKVWCACFTKFHFAIDGWIKKTYKLRHSNSRKKNSGGKSL